MKNVKGISIELHTLETILATSFQGDPNSDVSYSYIPGSMIRGAIISRYLRHHHLSELDLNDAKVKGLFFDAAQTLYLNAYLLSQEGKRTFPVPRSWFKDKDDKLPESDETGSMKIYDRAVEYDLPDDDENDDNSKITPKGIEQNFCTVKGQSVVLYSEKRRINIHHSRNRKKGKGTKDEGQIFRYEAIDSEQKFKAIILCQNTDLLGTLQELLPESSNIWFGGSQSAGYGKTKIEKVEPLADNWCEVEIPANQRVNNDRLIVTLLSDTILRDDCGQTVADANLIQSVIQQTIGEILPSPESVIIYASSTLIGGFNRKWGLPLPQVPALLAGSVIVFEGISLNTDQIQQLEYDGIGERRNEGFGRVVVNWQEKETLQATKPPNKKNQAQPILEETSHSLAKLIAERILRQRLDSQLLKKLGEDDTFIDKDNLDNISNSQLSRLWLAAREGLKCKNGSDASLEPVREFLKQDNLTKKAYEQFKTTRMKKNGDFLLDKILAWLDLNNPHSWMTINAREKLEITITDDIREGLNSELGKKLVTEYTLRLIMAVAKRATKEKD